MGLGSKGVHHESPQGLTPPALLMNSQWRMESGAAGRTARLASALCEMSGGAMSEWLLALTCYCDW